MVWAWGPGFFDKYARAAAAIRLPARYAAAFFYAF